MPSSDGLPAAAVIFLLLGAAVLLACWLPRFVSRREPSVAFLLLLFGTMASLVVPALTPLLNPLEHPAVWTHATEVCVILGLFGAGLRIDRRNSQRRWRPSMRLLAVAMPLAILAVTGVGMFAASLPLAFALLLAAALAPTDPVLAGALQVGRPHAGGEDAVRFALTTEAGLNDGLAFPFVHLALALVLAAAAATGMFEPMLWLSWFAQDLLYRCLAGALTGVLAGVVLGKVLFDWPRGNALARSETGVIAFAGVLLTYGVTELIGGYGFISAFVCGVCLRRDPAFPEFRIRLHDSSEAIEFALTAVLLVALGATLPLLLTSIDAAAIAVVLALLLIVRPLTAWVALHGLPLTGRERAVIAFYGIRGIGSLYYLAYATLHLPAEGDTIMRLWSMVALAIVLSSMLHGFTAGSAVDAATADARG